MGKKIEKFEIATLPEASEERRLAVFTTEGVDPLIKMIEDEARLHVPDVSTVQGRKDIASNAYKVSQSKVVLGKVGRSLTADMKSKCKAIDASINKVESGCDRVRDEVRQPLTDWENAEKAREEAERQKVLDELDRIERERVAAIEKREAELAAKEEALRLAEVARLAVIAADKEEKDRLEREATIAAEATVRAEREAKDAVERAEREKQETIERLKEERAFAVEAAKQAEIDAAKEQERQRIEAEQEQERAIKAERDRIAAEKLAEEKAAELREADTKHKGKINSAAVKAIEATCFTEPDHAKEIIKAIAKGLIPHVTISY